MATLELSARALADLERVFEFLAQADPKAALDAVNRIQDALQILTRHPLIGRPAGERELVISRGRTGYIALYRWVERTDTIIVGAIRHQREAGYAGD